MCFAFDLKDNAVKLFWIKILQELWAHFSLISFFSYFEKIAHMSVVWAYVSLWLCMFGCLLQGPIRLKVPWVGCLGTNEILASIKHGIVKDQTRALWDCHIDSSQFFHLLLRLQVFRSITLNIVMIQTLCTVKCSCLRVHNYFSVDAASRHFWPNSAIVNGTTHFNTQRISEFCFACFNCVEYKTSYIFKALHMKH